jgi:hypothetical protein
MIIPSHGQPTIRYGRCCRHAYDFEVFDPPYAEDYLE